MKDDNPYIIASERAIELIRAKREQESKRYIQTFESAPDLFVMNGRYGPYISYQKKNYRIPKKTDPAKLTIEECKEIIAKAQAKAKK
jgi:DNA topoisomerase-1